MFMKEVMGRETRAAARFRCVDACPRKNEAEHCAQSYVICCVIWEEENLIQKQLLC